MDNKIVKVIFIAGPYRSERGEYFVRQNIRNAEDAAVFIWQKGGVALCPHKNTSGFGGVVDDQRFLDGAMQLLERCDALFLVDGWEKSIGARREREYAINTNIPVFTDYYSLQMFLEAE
jgi:hypothetical protein